MDENRLKGAGQRIAGSIESAAGRLGGSAETEMSGRAREAVGEVQQNYGAAIDAARSFAVERPITALLAAAGIGFLFGLYTGRR